jgi:hypothetical protein
MSVVVIFLYISKDILYVAFIIEISRKLAAIRYCTNRINTWGLDHTKKQTETNIVKQIVSSNKFDTSILNRFNCEKTKREKDSQIYLLR